MAANSEASSSRPASAAPPKLACLCSPTNHPGSFRCIRHRSPRARLSSSPPPPSSSGGAGAAGRGEARAAAARSKGRSVRAHLLRMISSNSPSGRRRRRGDFQPRPSRLRQCAS